MKALLTFLVLTTSSFSWADSTEFGNGGKALVCGSRVTMYDSVEAEARYNMPPIFPKMLRAIECKQQSDSCTVLAKAIVGRLKKLDPELEASLQKLIDSFWSEAMITNSDLIPVNDTGVGFIERGCDLKQLAIQHEPLFPEDSRYLIARRLWDNMFDEDKATLIIHEVLYRHALQLVPETKSSENVRYFNALLISTKIGGLSSEKYQTIKIKVFPTSIDQ